MHCILIALMACFELTAPSLSTNPSRTAPTTRSQRLAPAGVGGLVPLKALVALPRGGAKPIGGYPSSELRAGVFRTSAAWRAFVAKAGARYRRLQVDWRRQMVVFVVFTGQTNALRFGQWVPPKGGTAELRFYWSGIEPFYTTATPGLFRVVPRRGVRKVVVRQIFHRAASRVHQTFAVQ